jgi:ATP-dependent DNA ligase
MKLKHVMKGPNEIVSFDHHAIIYPQLASQKFDGFRLLCLCGERLLSPALKEFPNRNLPLHFEKLMLWAREYNFVLDGEVWSPELTFNQLQSIVRSHHAEIPKSVGYYVFDMMTEQEWDEETEKPFIHRYLNYSQTLVGFPYVVPVEQHHIINPKEAEEFFNDEILSGHEGMILRQHHEGYKHGRTTLNQDGMWKFKEFLTQDGVVVGVEEQMKLKQGVERTRNEIGELERRYEQELYEPAGMVGAFIVQQGDLQFKVKPGKGMDNRTKMEQWVIRQHLIGRHCEFKSMPHGAKDKPRIGSLVRFRPDLD